MSRKHYIVTITFTNGTQRSYDKMMTIAECDKHVKSILSRKSVRSCGVQRLS